MNYKFYDETNKKELILNENVWSSKEVLFKNLYGDFYKYIKSHGGKKDLALHGIKNVKDFYAFADFYAEGKKECYAMGFAFHKYWCNTRVGGTLSEEPDTSFIGTCLKNGKYVDFFNFLVSYFAYWRNDEGCTCMNPYNHADEFFVSSWATLVDTTKLFYFTSETVYHWHSYRIKYILDHIPGTFLSNLPKKGLPILRLSGYEFLGWFDETLENEVVNTSSEQTVYAKFKQKDFYNYWEKEEKKIVKVHILDWKKVDPE